MRSTCLFLFLFASLFQAQTHRFIYDYQFKMDSTTTNYRKTAMVLDVNKDEIKFYEYQQLLNDSINKRGGSSYSWNNNPVLKRKRGSNTNVNYFMMKDYFSTNSTDKMDWVLSNETKKSGEYQLQKATTRFGGRQWTAWFCKDITINEGPYKFRGLPGLIFEISDDRKNFIFTLNKSVLLKDTFDTSDFLENFSKKKPVSIDLKTLHRIMLEFYNDPLREMRDKFDEKGEGIYKVGGIEVKSKEQFKDLTLVAQQHIRKSNNPLELDTAIIYPITK